MAEPSLYGTDLFGAPIEPRSRGKMADDFLVPPFTVLNAREGWWQERKRGWIAKGIKSELGRGANALGRQPECEEKRNGTYARTFGSGGPGTLDEQRAAWAKESNQAYPSADGESWVSGSGNAGKAERLSRVKKPDGGGLLGFSEQAPGLNHYRDQNKHTASLKTGHTEGVTCGPYDNRAGKDASAAESGTSIFDPVLCELAYRWFCPEDGQVIDPFAGGSVRGIVAALLGRHYWGCDLRAEQVEANREQAAAICPNNAPLWVCGDALDELQQAPAADFLFSCPPYGDLERYSDDPRDLSTMEYHTFTAAYRRVIFRAYNRLKPNAFAAFTVGEFRDGNGHYRNFVGDTVNAFRECGFQYYNEAILVTQVGSLPIRVPKQFNVSRKLGKTHQNVLVFVKRDARAAAKRCQGVTQEGHP